MASGLAQEFHQAASIFRLASKKNRPSRRCCRGWSRWRLRHAGGDRRSTAGLPARNAAPVGAGPWSGSSGARASQMQRATAPRPADASPMMRNQLPRMRCLPTLRIRSAIQDLPADKSLCELCSILTQAPRSGNREHDFGWREDEKIPPGSRRGPAEPTPAAPPRPTPAGRQPQPAEPREHLADVPHSVDRHVDGDVEYQIRPAAVISSQNQCSIMVVPLLTARPARASAANRLSSRLRSAGR